MKLNPKTPSAKVLALKQKLEELANRGIDGEKAAAREKLERLKARYDFSAPAPGDDDGLFIFSGKFRPARKARKIFAFESHESDVASSVKWAIESATKIQCVYRGNDLLAEATAGTATRLAEAAQHIAESFRTLLRQFNQMEGVTPTDRAAFIRGLYDGMMNEVRPDGELLPGAFRRAKTPKAKKNSPASARLNVHPYSLAVPLGKQIRFSAPITQIAAELQAAAAGQLPA